MNDILIPKEIVAELDKYIIGQEKAKKVVAIALRNRWRRQQSDESIREEIIPNNIILIGSTGVGKTEIARRLANLAQAPFIKVEASKFTEVGYVGRDVESIIRDLTEGAVHMVRAEQGELIKEKSHQNAIERMLDILLSPPPENADEESIEQYFRSREKMRARLINGKFDNREIEIPAATQETLPQGMHVVGAIGGFEDLPSQIQDMFENVLPQPSQPKKTSVEKGLRILEREESNKLLNKDQIVREAIRRTENRGIVFLDEIDKIISERGTAHGPDVSREGVQRNILPIVEGSAVNTKYGPVNTDHILFVAAGAFHICKPSDMIPELQGRFPIRVEMDNLTTEDFVKILTQPRNSLIRQYTALLNAENVHLKFNQSSIREIAKIATKVNDKTENIGARRLHTVMSTLLEDAMFEKCNTRGEQLQITKKMVSENLADIVEDEDLSNYIL